MGIGDIHSQVGKLSNTLFAPPPRHTQREALKMGFEPRPSDFGVTGEEETLGRRRPVGQA